MPNQHPQWHGPHGESNLKVNNSLTETKTPFIPHDGNKVSMYMCGPTVYDSAHLGHARAYVTFDILRRILSDFFGYDVTYVMNITDLDDKIILRARQNYLFAQYLKKTTQLQQVAADIQAAFKATEDKMTAKIPQLEAQVATANSRYLADMKEALQNQRIKLQNVQNDKKAFDEKYAEVQASNPDAKSAIALLAPLGKSVLSASLDAKLGSGITDHSIFLAHAQKYEAEFLKDMRDLGVRDADVLTRVTEYVPKIIVFIQKIMQNGYAYESKGSVYFDVAEFKKAHDYGKLCPWSVGNEQLVADGEGSLSGPAEKKSGDDFALWKTSKPGEPSWESPWGNGRPGWHIECSCMCTDILGDNVDIHGGGIDLRFPHHDNELAQSEAACGCKQWINHFWHAGHLNIRGCKMSKSLKNFLTIRDVLNRYTARQIRILFLLQAWDKPMTYSDDSLEAAQNKEKQINHFFGTIKSIRRNRPKVAPESWTAVDRKLHETLEATKISVRAALEDNFNYPLVMEHLFGLMSAVNLKLDANPQVLLLNKIAQYIDGILAMFGVKGDADFGFQSGSADTEAVVSKYMDAFAAFRAAVRSNAQKGVDNKVLLQLCDDLRDNVMPELGVMLEDVARSEKGYIWKLGDPKTLIAERDEKLEQARQKKFAKAKNQLKRAQDDLTKWTEASKPPSEFFAENKNYTDFSEDGLPGQIDGKVPSKGVMKKLKKSLNKHKTAHKKFEGNVKKNPNFLQDLQAAVVQKQQALDALLN